MNMSSFIAVGLFLVFVGLKLTGYIAWSWIWVLAPLWIYFIIAFAVVFGIVWLQTK